MGSDRFSTTSSTYEPEHESAYTLDPPPKTKPFQALRNCPGATWRFIKGITWKGWLTLLILLVLALLLVAFLIYAPWPAWLGYFLQWVEYLGWWGPVLLTELYIACTLLFIPGSILTIGAGFAFQSVWIGTVSVSIGSTIGACGAFLYGNTLLRGWVERKIIKYPIFKAIDIAIAEKGWLIVLLLRLSPVVPYNLLNYALGLTNVGFWTYAIVSWIGMLPATIVYVWIGTALESVAEIISGTYQTNWETEVLFWGGLVCTFVALVVTTVYAKKVINRTLAQAAARKKLEEEEEEEARHAHEHEEHDFDENDHETSGLLSVQDKFPYASTSQDSSDF